MPNARPTANRPLPIRAMPRPGRSNNSRRRWWHTAGSTARSISLPGTTSPTTRIGEVSKRPAAGDSRYRTRCRYAATTEQIDAYINHWDTARKALPFPTDGVVIKVNRFSDRRALGFTAKAPKWAVAYKFKAEQALTRLLKVTYQVGRTGAITPVANLEPGTSGRDNRKACHAPQRRPDRRPRPARR